jgi:triose/dihydroxyacetone kinase / FAD-AMP lyase (cyclizing)
LTLTNPSLVFDKENKIVYRHPSSISDSENKISLVSGGGSGHEPTFAGYVGRGILTACVAGTIFSSPSAEQIRTCIAHRLPKDTKGVLVLVMNYTGDVLNFGMGVEKARAMGKKVEMVITGDDVGVGRKKGGKVGRRGIAGVVLVAKVCGALAEMGEGLEEVARVGGLVGDNVVSVAASLSRTHVIGRPASDAVEEAERLPAGTLELGMGIHNEPGCEKLETELPGTVGKMLAQLLDTGDEDRAFLKWGRGDEFILLINNFGGLSNLELGAITTEVWMQLNKDYGLTPVRVVSGVINGSLNGLGFGVTLLRLADTDLGPGKSMLELIDAPSEAVGWPGAIETDTWERKYAPMDQKISGEQDRIPPSNIIGKQATEGRTETQQLTGGQ